MRLALVLAVVGHLLRRFAFAFVPPALLAAWQATESAVAVPELIAFAAAGAITGLLGHVLGRGFPATLRLQRSEALAVVALSWLAVAACGALPYAAVGLDAVDAFFESMSGFTTTGATILTDFGAHDQAFYLWRAMTQWFGGLGVIALFVVVLPRLGIAGRQLFFAEASTAAGEAVSPQIREAARRLWILYSALTGAQVVALLLADMGLYEAVVHALTTMSAGGFSPHPESVRGYANPAAEWVFVGFMVLSGTSFTLQYRVLTGHPFAWCRDREFLAYAGTMAVLALGAAFLLGRGQATEEGLRAGAFQVASLMSSTGYASADFEQWAPGLKAVLLLAMFVGGCAGSACGGPKVVRYVLTGQWLRREFTQVLHPRAVIPLRYGGMSIPNEVMRAVTTLVFLYILGYAALGAAVVLVEGDVDLVTGYSSAVACMGNIGPGFGAAGPMGSYAFYSDASKVLLALSMWIGRLEIVTVLALLHPHVLRHLRWRGESTSARR